MAKNTSQYWNPLIPENDDKWKAIEGMGGFAGFGGVLLFCLIIKNETYIPLKPDLAVVLLLKGISG